MFQAFYPKEYVDSTYEIDFEGLYRRGYRGILFDVDNTLVPHGAPATAQSVELFQRLHERALHRLICHNKEPGCVLSRTPWRRPLYIKADKPSRRGYEEGMLRMGTDKTNTLFVGDSFSPMYGGPTGRACTRFSQNPSIPMRRFRLC